ncbi:MAG: hypothetical protein JJT94_01195, partial [Bernardetiaceae bacterium]|nr:hypothetical protein [Bernardetiaceae bacterium]
MSLVGIEERDLQSVQGAEEYRFLFNGKERETALSLHLYDFHARQQDPQLGRFWGVDALASKYFSLSPFAHVANNPLIFIDPDGREIFTSGNSTTYTGADAVNFVASMQAEMGGSSFGLGFKDGTSDAYIDEFIHMIEGSFHNKVKVQYNKEKRLITGIKIRPENSNDPYWSLMDEVHKATLDLFNEYLGKGTTIIGLVKSEKTKEGTTNTHILFGSYKQETINMTTVALLGVDPRRLNVRST